MGDLHEIVMANPRVIAANQCLKKAMAAISSNNRWGECRRFAGRSAGLRLERYHKAQSAFDRAYAFAERQFAKTSPVSDLPIDKRD